MATVEEALQQAAANRDAGRLDVAESVYRAILATFPQHAKALQGLNDVLQAQGKAPEQARVLPETELQNLLSLYETGRLSEAAQTAATLIERFPQATILHNVLGATRLNLNDPGGAVDCFRTVLDLDPNAAESHNNLGIALHRLGSYELAAEQFVAALALNTDFQDAYKNLGALYVDMGRTEEAIEALRRGDPDNLDADTSALLLESYFRKGDRTAFDIQVQLIKIRQDAINIRASAAVTFAAQQRGIRNFYEFCADPFALITTFDVTTEVAEDTRWLAKGPPAMDDLLEIDNCAADLPDNAAYLRDDSNPPLQEFKQDLQRLAGAYHDRLASDDSLFIQGWPREFTIAARRIRHSHHEDTTAHVHRSWLSGILCLGGDPAGSGGCIEFTLRGYDLPEIHDDYPQETGILKPGTLILFPSSLPHRIKPNLDDESQLLIILDFLPN